MTVILEGPDAPLTRPQATDALYRPAFFSSTFATMATRSSAQSPRPVRRMSEAGVTSKTTIPVTPGNCGIVPVVVLTAIKGAFS